MEKIDFDHWLKELPDNKNLVNSYRTALEGVTLPDFKDPGHADDEKEFQALVRVVTCRVVSRGCLVLKELVRESTDVPLAP